MMPRADHPSIDRCHELASPPVIEVRLHPPILLQILWPPLREQESRLETGCKALLNSRDFDGADNDLFHFQLPHVIPDGHPRRSDGRSEEHTSELQSLMRISYAVLCLTKQTTHNHNTL